MTNQASARRRVLVVDDNADLREMLSDLLQLEEIEVACCADGSEALKYLKLADPLPDAIILDFMMPVMSGAEFLRERRKDSTLEEIPVILLSAATEEIRNSVASDVAMILPKPFDPVKVLESVRTIARVKAKRRR